MNFHPLDLAIIIGYLILMICLGFWVSKKASKSLRAYFLGDNKISWYYLGLSNASGMFDVSGTMWMVTLFFVYGVKSAWIPWLWPVWNQVFIMVFLAIWLRRSNVLTGAEWITHRFGNDRGAKLAHMIVTIFAIVSVFGFMAYFFVGIGKFATVFFPWDLSLTSQLINLTSEQSYALLLILVTTVYAVSGGMYSVVLTEVLQFIIMTISCLVVGVIALINVSRDQIVNAVPDGWGDLWFSWRLDMDWTGYLDSVNDKISSDGFELFGYLFMMMIFKGIFASIAGPVPSYDMQRVLSTKSPMESAKMGGLTMLALYFPRYLMIAGFGVLAVTYLLPEFDAMGANIDFETILPIAIDRFIPIGFKGLLLAGLLAAFMSTLAAFINAAPAYVVNDFYKKYINPNATDRTYVKYSYYSSFGIVIIGLIFGFFVESLNSLTLWITSALYGGYAAANVLKWLWWRFNGYGYFCGMLAGLVSSSIFPILFPEVSAIYLFPPILIFSFAGSIIGTLLTQQQDFETLSSFYKQTYPWGFWKPVVAHIQKTQPSFVANPHLKLDSVNVLVGIVWQTTLTVMPIFIILKNFPYAFITFIVFASTSYFLKKNWYDKLSTLSMTPMNEPPSASMEAQNLATSGSFSNDSANTESLSIPWEERPQGNSNVLWRYSENPIIKRDHIPSSNSIFNSAVVPFNGGYAGVFRCDDKNIRMNIHTGFSKDGINWEIENDPIKMSAGNTEMLHSDYKYDPRVTKIEDKYWVTWCNGYHGPTIGLAYTYDFKEYFQCENALLPYNRNGVLFPEKINGKYVLLSRPSDNGHTAFGDMYISYSPDMKYWGEHRMMMKVSNFEESAWQSKKIGGGAVPILVDEGWLIIYHGVINTCNGFRYAMGGAIVAKDDPSNVLYRSGAYLLTPTTLYETTGDVPNVIFPCASIEDKNRIVIYYGAADTSVAIAFGYIYEVIDFIKKNDISK